MEENDKLEQESDETEKSDVESTSENKAEALDSAVSKTEENNETAEDSGEEVVKEEKIESEVDSSETAETEEKSESADDSSEELVKEDEEEAKEAEVVEEDKEPEEKNYAEISEENKAPEEISEEAESEDTDVADVSEQNNKSEDNKEAVEPEIEEVETASDEAVEDADITEKEASDHGIEEVSLDKKSSEVNSEESDSEKKSEEVTVVEEVSSESKNEETALIVEESSVQKPEETVGAEVESSEPKSEEKSGENSSVEEVVEEIIIIEETQESSSSSSKPQAVLDELNKLKTAKTESESAEVKADDKVEQTKADDKVEEVKADTESEAKETQSSVENKVESAPAASDDHDDSSEEFSFSRIFNMDFWKSFLFDIFFLGLCVWFTFMLIQKWFSTREVIIQGTNQVHGLIESGEKTTIGNINVLVMGIDSVEGTHRSDTIFVLGVNPSKKKIMMLSIPRDTKVDIEGKSRKINEILPRYGEPTLRIILEELLKIKISRKVEVGFESFIAVVDAIGGVDINIEKPMHYDDNWGNLHIHFNPGMNHLNGQDALRYVRFRKDAMADLGRIKRQQEFVKAVVKKLFSPTIIVKLPSIIETAFKYIKTDFTLQEILTLAKGFDTFDVKFTTLSLPGDARYVDKISFFIPYSEEAIAIGNNYFSDLAILELEKDCDFGKVIPKPSKTNRKK